MRVECKSRVGEGLRNLEGASNPPSLAIVTYLIDATCDRQFSLPWTSCEISKHAKLRQ